MLEQMGPYLKLVKGKIGAIASHYDTSSWSNLDHYLVALNGREKSSFGFLNVIVLVKSEKKKQKYRNSVNSNQ